jgi:hypothetical protein
MLKHPFSPRLLKKVQMSFDRLRTLSEAEGQGEARCEARGVLPTYVAAPRERDNAAGGPFSAAC